MKKRLVFGLVWILIAGGLFAAGQQEAPEGEVTGATSAAVEEIYVFKYAHTQSPNHPRSLSMDYFKEQLEEASDGRIEVELFYNGVLGTEAEVLDMVKLGTVQGSRGGLFERANVKFLIYTLPFMFNNTDQVEAVMFGPVGQMINEGALENGIYIPATGVAGGFRNITNSLRPIETVEDIVGLKMRTPPIDMTIKTFGALGANPQQVPYTETYMALKTGIVDGQENPFSNIVDMKFYEAQTYLSLLNWQIHPDPFYVNPEWYNNLSADLQEIFDEVAADTMKYSNDVWLGAEAEYLDTLSDYLVVNEVSESAHEGFVAAVNPVWQEYVDEGTFTWAEIGEVLNYEN